MHFRERKRVIQVIRTVYNPGVKRGTSLIVGRLLKDHPEVTDELRDALTAAEVAEVQQWLSARAARAGLVREHAVRSLEEQLSRVAEWFKGQPVNADTRAAAVEVSAALSKLQKQLRKRGFLHRRKELAQQSDADASNLAQAGLEAKKSDVS